MKKLIRVLRSDKILFRFSILTLVFILISFLWTLIRYRDLPPIVPIFNQLPWGETRLSEKPGIFLPLIIIASIFALNSVVSTSIYEKTPLISRMLSVTTFLVSLLGLLFIFRTIELIT
jgi:hypothetical protein